jgi:hypothetical protein
VPSAKADSDHSFIPSRHLRAGLFIFRRCAAGASIDGNLDANAQAIYCLHKKTMLPVFGIVAECVIIVGLAFILSKTVPSMPNKVCCFVFLFVLWVPVNFLINYIRVRAFGTTGMSWTGASIIALILATWGTFLSSQQNSNTP